MGGRVFSGVRAEARAWIRAPGDDLLARLTGLARDASSHVPASRRSDWDKLVAGFGAPEEGARRRARVEGLVRACALFEREERATQRRNIPLAWDDPVERAERLGPAARSKLAARGVSVVADLVWTLPAGWDDLRAPLGVRRAVEVAREREETLAPAQRQCVRGVVKTASVVWMRGKKTVRVVVDDVEGGAPIDAWWFYAAHGILAMARPGTACLLVGLVHARHGKRPTMAHPDFLLDDPGVAPLRPRYPAMGLPAANLRRAIRDALERSTPLPDPVPAGVVARESMPAVEPLLLTVHGAAVHDLPEEARRALTERLAWVEAFTRVWQRISAERASGSAEAPNLTRDVVAMGKTLAAFGFALTGSQQRAIDTIGGDLASPIPMRRLLLGDVGTGKTAVALAAAAQCVTAGFQCALLVPTGLLVDQYVEAAAPVANALGIRVARVTSQMRSDERRRVLASVALGETPLVLGTHALLEQGVDFARLGLVIVDEQHRLGVAQRLTLVRKGRNQRPHLLSLSATPIPRTMALALRGELATTVLDERPLGRSPAVAEILPRARADAVMDEVRRAVERDERVFFVCPRIKDDVEEEEVGVQARAQALARSLGPTRVTMVHGAMSAERQAGAVRDFRSGEARVLVGTTVVEVGLDVPEATLMVIDCAERFGLAQLHQLRGRVGRGRIPGKCLLLHEEPLGLLGRRRLEALAKTTDGSAIARADLELRGAGDLGGTRQSGVVEDLVWLDPNQPPAWIERIEADATAILARDPSLAAPEHRALALAVRRFAVALAVREEAG